MRKSNASDYNTVSKPYSVYFVFFLTHQRRMQWWT